MWQTKHFVLVLLPLVSGRYLLPQICGYCILLPQYVLLHACIFSGIWQIF